MHIWLLCVHIERGVETDIMDEHTERNHHGVKIECLLEATGHIPSQFTSQDGRAV